MVICYLRLTGEDCGEGCGDGDNDIDSDDSNDCLDSYGNWN